MTSINEEVTWDGPKHGPLPIHRLDVRFREPCAYLCTVTSEDRALILDMYTTIPKKGERWFPMVLIHWGDGLMGWCNFRANTGGSNISRVAIDHAFAELETRWWQIASLV